MAQQSNVCLTAPASTPRFNLCPVIARSPRLPSSGHRPQQGDPPIHRPLHRPPSCSASTRTLPRQPKQKEYQQSAVCRPPTSEDFQTVAFPASAARRRGRPQARANQQQRALQLHMFEGGQAGEHTNRLLGPARCCRGLLRAARVLPPQSQLPKRRRPPVGPLGHQVHHLRGFIFPRIEHGELRPSGADRPAIRSSGAANWMLRKRRQGRDFGRRAMHSRLSSCRLASQGFPCVVITLLL
jgi:hypothetical protein